MKKCIVTLTLIIFVSLNAEDVNAENSVTRGIAMLNQLGMQLVNDIKSSPTSFATASAVSFLCGMFIHRRLSGLSRVQRKLDSIVSLLNTIKSNKLN